MAGIIDFWTLSLMAFGLLVLLAVLLLWLRMRGGRKPSPHVRLDVTDFLELDKTRRLVIVRRDDVEHLILIGGPQDLVIETGFRAASEGGIGVDDEEPEADAADAADQPVVPGPAPSPLSLRLAERGASLPPLRAAPRREPRLGERQEPVIARREDKPDEDDPAQE